MQGKAILEYAFDVGGDIDISKLKETKLKKATVTEKMLTAKYAQSGLEAVVLELGEVEAAGHTFAASAEIYPIGDAILRFEKEFKQYGEAEELFALSESAGMVEMARRFIAELMDKMRICLVNPYEHRSAVQPYAIVTIKEKPGKDEEWITRLLRQTKKPSKQEIADCVKHSVSYETDDLAIVDYAGAIMFDPAGDFQGGIDMINIALVQLTALRTYDLLLDWRVVKAYDDMKLITRRSGLIPHTTETDRAIRETLEAKLTIADMLGDLTNIAKISGDWYLARVYGAASDRFKLDAWFGNLKRKLDDLESFNLLFREQMEGERSWISNVIMLILESLIVVLIIFEMLLK